MIVGNSLMSDQVQLGSMKALRRRGFEVEFHSHAEAILSVDFPAALRELENTLERLSIPVESLVAGGGGEHTTTQQIRRELSAIGWVKHSFEIKKLIDGVERESISHEVDHVRTFDQGKIALEIEWNNKDPFFDRDLENFKRLHAEGAVSVGAILTRGSSLQAGLRAAMLRFATARGISSYDDLSDYMDPTTRQRKAVASRMARGSSFAEAWASVFCSDKFGQATTHWSKLQDRVRRGVGNPCPILLIGIPMDVVSF